MQRLIITHPSSWHDRYTIEKDEKLQVIHLSVHPLMKYKFHWTVAQQNYGTHIAIAAIQGPPSLIRSAQQAHEVIMTSDSHRCDGMTSYRCQYDVNSAPCACWAVIRPDSVYSGKYTTLMVTNEKQEIPLN